MFSPYCARSGPLAFAAPSSPYISPYADTDDDDDFLASFAAYDHLRSARERALLERQQRARRTAEANAYRAYLAEQASAARELAAARARAQREYELERRRRALIARIERDQELRRLQEHKQREAVFVRALEQHGFDPRPLDDGFVRVVPTPSSIKPKPAQASPYHRIAAATKIQRVFRQHLSRRSKLAALEALASDLATRKASFQPGELSFDTAPGVAPKTLTYSSGPNADLRAYEDALVRLLTRLDAVESEGDALVKARRKTLVRDVEHELAALDTIKEEQWSQMFAKAPREASVTSNLGTETIVPNASLTVSGTNPTIDSDARSEPEQEIAMTTNDPAVATPVVDTTPDSTRAPERPVEAIVEQTGTSEGSEQADRERARDPTSERTNEPTEETAEEVARARMDLDEASFVPEPNPVATDGTLAIVDRPDDGSVDERASVDVVGRSSSRAGSDDESDDGSVEDLVVGSSGDDPIATANAPDQPTSHGDEDDDEEGSVEDLIVDSGAIAGDETRANAPGSEDGFVLVR